MEKRFKKDVLRELKVGNGRILLHDELEERPGVFSVVPLWETVSDDDILTPRDVFEMVAKEGYRVRSLLSHLVLSFMPFIRSITAVLLL
jgi:hypothetical protein